MREYASVPVALPLRSFARLTSVRVANRISRPYRIVPTIRGQSLSLIAVVGDVTFAWAVVVLVVS